jgi:hypothetical protein
MENLLYGLSLMCNLNALNPSGRREVLDQRAAQPDILWPIEMIH